MKVAIIGAGSIGFTREIVRDILCVPEFADVEIVFTDIDERNLDMVYQLCRRDIDAAGLPAKLTATLNRRGAIAEAKKRLASPDRIAPRDYAGVRVPEKSVEEMRKARGS